jgi:hypothetical protein
MLWRCIFLPARRSAPPPPRSWSPAASANPPPAEAEWRCQSDRLVRCPVWHLELGVCTPAQPLPLPTARSACTAYAPALTSPSSFPAWSGFFSAPPSAPSGCTASSAAPCALSACCVVSSCSASFSVAASSSAPVAAASCLGHTHAHRSCYRRSPRSTEAGAGVGGGA